MPDVDDGGKVSEVRKRPKLLIVDDGDRYVELAHTLLRNYDFATRCELRGPCWECPERPGCKLTHAHDWGETLEALSRHEDLDAVLLDVAFDLPVERLVRSDDPDLERRRRLQGLSILPQLRRRRAELPVILMTSREELALEHADGALDADEFVTLAGRDAFDARALSLLIERVLARTHVSPTEGHFFWGNSAAMARLRRDIESLAPTSLPLLLLGETGTGKSALAEHVIHRAAGRRGPFLSVDLSTLPDTLAAAELFGTARGAFSGAVDRPGLFERADGGTLLLDEIGNLGLDGQRMLLLALQNRRVTRLGSAMPISIDVKLIAATNVDLELGVREGRFRGDLLARLNPALRLTLPPLRDRVDDLLSLMTHFCTHTFGSGTDRALLDRYAVEAGLVPLRGASLALEDVLPSAHHDELVFVLSRSSFEALSRHAWPGNVRELELFTRTAALLALTDAKSALAHGRPLPGDARLVPFSARLLRDLTTVKQRARKEATHSSATPWLPQRHLRDVTQALERRVMEELYRETGGDFEAMARKLLTGDATHNARRVRLRFNQLGLRVRKPKKI